MTYDEVFQIAKTFVDHGVTKIRLTGGEPLIRRDVDIILKKLATLPVELSITSNAVIIDRFIDILKECDLLINFTEQMETIARSSQINQADLQKRLLLCLYGIGSNTGLKRISIANGDVKHSDLRYIKKRFRKNLIGWLKNFC